MKKKLNVKRKIKKLYKDNTLEINIAVVILVLGLLILSAILIFQSNIKEYKTDTYTIKYDRSWKRKGKNENTIKLKHKSKSTIYIEVMELNEEQKYLETEDLIEELLYSIGLENKEYNILQKEKTNITRHSYEGYKLLYENKTHQAMVVVAKKSEKVMLFTYEAKHEYFDILLDSVENIIYNFDINDKKYLINNSVKVDTKEISFKENKELLKSLKKNEIYEIAYENYYAKLSIPSNFNLKNFDSTYGSYTYEGLKEGSINLTASIYPHNIYEYLEKKEEIGKLYNDLSYQRDKKNTQYKNLKESLTQIKDDKYNSYLYKATYDYELGNSKNKYEHYIKISELDNNHILVFKIESKDNVIPKELIDKLKFSDVTNYANYIPEETNLKRFGDEDTIDEVVLKLNEKYQELDYGLNMYTYRYFGLNYNRKNDIYEYEVKYTLTSKYQKIENIVNYITIYKNPGPYQTLVNAGKINLNGKDFIVYNGGYTRNGQGYVKNLNSNTYYVHKKLLLHELPTGGYLQIEIDGNGVEISQEVLNDLTNIDIIKIGKR